MRKRGPGSRRGMACIAASAMGTVKAEADTRVSVEERLVDFSSPVRDNDLRVAVNTNRELFEHPPTRTFYHRHETQWLQASALRGPWTVARTLPHSFGRLPAADDNWKDVRAALPGRNVSPVPTVFVSTVPAELVFLRGGEGGGVVTRRGGGGRRR